jgi:hypothetical protein
MSDEVQEKLEGVRRALLKNSIFFGIGWVVMMMMIALSFVRMSSPFYKFTTVLPFIGWFIIGLPKIWIVIKGGGLGGALKADYEVVTTYGDGRKESDGGLQSMGTNLFGKLIQIGLLYVIGGFVQIIHLIILSVKSVVLHIKAQPKPAFIKSGLFIIVMNIAVFIGSVVLAMVIYQVGKVAREAAHRASAGMEISGDFMYSLNEAKDGIILEEYFGKKGGDIVIPATFDGKPLVGIQGRIVFSEGGSKNWGFNDNRNERITSVVIPDTVTFIDGSAFSHCTELKQITLPKNLKFIGGSTFEGSGITSVTIPEGVTDIGSSAFVNCKNLTSVTLPRSLQRVGSSAFRDCTSLVNVTIPSGNTIQYGVHSSSSENGGSVIESLRAYTQSAYFVAAQDYRGSEIMDYQVKQHFKGCSSLSAASRQAIEDSGYIGEF